MQRVLTFLSTSYGTLVVLAGAMSIVWGFIKNGGEVRKWVVGLVEAHKKRKAAPEKTLELIRDMAEDQAKKDNAQQEQLNEMHKLLEGIDARLDTLENKVDGVDSQVGTVQHEKLMWAYGYYGIQRHPISITTRTSLELMYDQYTDDGKHNHIPQDFKEIIRKAPLEGAEEHRDTTT